MIFDEKSTSRCQSIIQRLAGTYQSAEFTPHITLAGIPETSLDEINRAIAEIAGKTSQLALETTTIRCSSNPYQKLTHGIQSTPQLRHLHQKMDALFEGDFAKREYPHISYLYSGLDCSKVSHEVKEIEKQAPKKIIANQLALVRCKGTPEEWRTLFEWDIKN